MSAIFRLAVWQCHRPPVKFIIKLLFDHFFIRLI